MAAYESRYRLVVRRITLNKKKACISAGFFLTSGSTTWTRTRDPMINSHLLYQLSYRGIRRMLLIEKEKSSIHIVIRQD